MPSRKKIDLKAVRACLTTTCTKCGRDIEPAKQIRVNSVEMVCPWCGERFAPKQKAASAMS